MFIEVPTGARLQNIEAFTKRVAAADSTDLTIRFPTTYFSVHPMVSAAVAAAGLRATGAGGTITMDAIPETSSMRYLHRMGLFDILKVDPNLLLVAREEAGRFVPLTVIRSGAELSAFIINLVPLFHTQPRQAEPIQYVISELVRNALEHSGPQPTAVVAAQVFPKSGIVAIGVADAGQGIRESLAPSYGTADDLSAIQLALRPGITGTTRRVGGTADNAGAGLFFCKAMAYTSRNHMVMYSGTGLYKLLRRRQQDELVIYHDANFDRATRHGDAPRWPGTLVGIDLDLTGFTEFSSFLTYIRKAYQLDVKAESKARYKAKARFV